MARQSIATSGSNRGFKAPRGGRAIKPVVAGAGSGRGPSDPFAPHLPKQKGLGRKDGFFIWPNPPASWGHSVGEWIVYWYLTVRKHMQEGKDFYYQSRVYSDRLFSNQNFTQADFVVDLGPTSVRGPLGHYKALVFDPYTNFTHDRNFDIERRNELEDANYRLIYMETDALMLMTERIMEEALRGNDLSDRGGQG